MKKLMICMFAAAAAMGLMANGSNQANSQTEKMCETTCVHDSHMDGEAHVESEGFGRCSKCNCKAFEGRGETCRNCGHAYNKHY